MTLLGQGPMAKKKTERKTESRKHTAMIRVSEKVRERAALAARMMGLSLADYCDDVLTKGADKDIVREAKKLSGGEA